MWKSLRGKGVINMAAKFAGLDYANMLVELREIISDLHDEYHRQGF